MAPRSRLSADLPPQLQSQTPAGQLRSTFHMEVHRLLVSHHKCPDISASVTIPVVTTDFSTSSPSSSPVPSTSKLDSMAPEDAKAPFTRIPWIARMINKAGIVWKVPGSRIPKDDLEDSLFAEILKTPRTIRSCMVFYKRPVIDTDLIEEVNVVMTVGDGLNGHPAIIHGGITATLCDEAMGMYQGVNNERAHMAKVKLGHAEGELAQEVGSFTAELKITYLKPVLTPGALIVTCKRVKKEGRKEWLRTEVKQCQGHGEDDDGEIVVCAVGEGLFITPKHTPKL